MNSTSSTPGCAQPQASPAAPSRQLPLKRALDLILGSILLVAALPLLLLCALLIRLETPGPVLFRQIRIGRGFRPFLLLKLRTMHTGSDECPYTLRDDSRITGIGRLLRRSKLDELPQLLNILRGDLSLVGPRPVLPAIVERFPREYAALLQVRPGLTDPASLHYFREDDWLSRSLDPRREFLEIITPHKLRLSAGYIQRATLATDLRLLARTFVAVLHALRGFARQRLSNPVRTAQPLCPIEWSSEPGEIALHTSLDR